MKKYDNKSKKKKVLISVLVWDAGFVGLKSTVKASNEHCLLAVTQYMGEVVLFKNYQS